MPVAAKTVSKHKYAVPGKCTPVWYTVRWDYTVGGCGSLTTPSHSDAVSYFFKLIGEDKKQNLRRYKSVEFRKMDEQVVCITYHFAATPSTARPTPA